MPVAGAEFEGNQKEGPDNEGTPATSGSPRGPDLSIPGENIMHEASGRSCSREIRIQFVSSGNNGQEGSGNTFLSCCSRGRLCVPPVGGLNLDR